MAKKATAAGLEKKKIRTHQKAKAKKKRADDKWNSDRALERKLRGRERGHTGIAQIICDETKKRWEKEGRKPTNSIRVSR